MSLERPGRYLDDGTDLEKKVGGDGRLIWSQEYESCSIAFENRWVSLIRRFSSDEALGPLEQGHGDGNRQISQ